MIRRVVVVEPRVMAVHLVCRCCGDCTSLIAPTEDDFETDLIAQGSRWMDNHLAPEVDAVELLVDGQRTILDRTDIT